MASTGGPFLASGEAHQESHLDLHLRRVTPLLLNHGSRLREVFAPAEYIAALEGIDLAEISITSGAAIAEGEAPDSAFSGDEDGVIRVVIGAAPGEKCARCWKVLEEVDSDAEFRHVCLRCADAVRRHSMAAQ